MSDSATPPAAPNRASPTLPDQVATFRHLDPAAALAFRTPLQEHPPAADTKAAAILTALGIMLTLLARLRDAPDGDAHWAGGSRSSSWSSCCSASPARAWRRSSRRSGRSPRGSPPAPPSLAFFGDIARLSREEYLARVGSISHEEALEQILIYNHTLATICVDKFRHLGRGVRLFRWAFACWLVLIVLVNLRILF